MAVGCLVQKIRGAEMLAAGGKRGPQEKNDQGKLSKACHFVLF